MHGLLSSDERDGTMGSMEVCAAVYSKRERRSQRTMAEGSMHLSLWVLCTVSRLCSRHFLLSSSEAYNLIAKYHRSLVGKYPSEQLTATAAHDTHYQVMAKSPKLVSIAMAPTLWLLA